MDQHDRAAAAAGRRALAAISGRDHVIFLGRASAGIYALLRAWHFEREWIALPANTCYIVLWAILKSGNYPLLADIDPTTGTLDSDLLHSLPYRPAALIVPHLYGIPSAIQRIGDWARTHDVRLIEDCAQAIGSTIAGQPIGSWGDAAVFSFGPGKIVDHGGGGALVTQDSALARELRRILAALPTHDSHHQTLQSQWDSLYWALHQHEDVSAGLRALYPQLYALYTDLIAYRMPGDFWRGLTGKLRALPEQLAVRRDRAAAFDERLKGLPVRTLNRDGFALWRYPLVIDRAKRDSLLAHLWSTGFTGVTRWYPSLRWMLSALQPSVPIPDTPHSDRLSASIINLPLEEGLSEHGQVDICGAISEYFEQQALYGRGA